MRRGAVAYSVALLATCVGAGAAGRVVADRLDDRDARRTTHTTPTSVVRPPAGQVLVSGAIDAFAADGAKAAPVVSPLTLTAVTRGEGKATIENALVGGERTTIFWGGGTPLPISGEGGGIDLSGARLDVTSEGAVWSPTGAARPFVPGRYRAGAPVAVGEQGLGRPQDSVAFEADSRTVLSATEGVVVKLLPSTVTVEGPGRVAIAGRLRVVESGGERDAAKVELAGGSYQVTITPDGTGLRIQAVLQGDYRAT